MNRRPKGIKLAAVAALWIAAAWSGSSAAATPAKTSVKAQPSHVQRGKYLVTIMGCNDCHTPWKMGANGPEQDMTRMLSGHPESDVVTAPAALGQAPWMAAVSNTFTAWSGPWGVSFTANLTPDPETGLGKWTAETFLQALRTGKHEGVGRPILPPMPYPMIGKATDEDLRAIFAYLQSIPPIRNR
ncbi:MAG TPA: c-type cytochrome, partial [Candidatus Eisenbacteria bacterium]|nr:c-type cytochrome [Candidatus Eisenbacteria bacterium]